MSGCTAQPISTTSDSIVVDDDVERGKRGLARQRRVVIGGSIATVAVLTAVTIAASQLVGDDTTPGGAGIAGQPSGAPDVPKPTPDGSSPAPDEPRTEESMPPGGDSTVPEEGTSITDPDEMSADSADTKPWRDDLYALAGQYLDPQRTVPQLRHRQRAGRWRQPRATRRSGSSSAGRPRTTAVKA